MKPTGKLCRIRPVPCSLFIAFVTASVAGQEPVLAQDDIPGNAGLNGETGDRNFSLFISNDLLRVTLAFDLSAFTKKPSRDDSFDADLTIYTGKDDSLSRKVIIRYRGTSRYEMCSFPPMQLNFRKAILIDSVAVRKLKLVTHCQSQAVNDEYVLREYLVYRMFNALTDTSLRVRLLKITYVDPGKNKKPVTRYGIFIEPPELLAHRTGCMVIRNEYLNQTHISAGAMDRLAVFNYMVSNWDWSVPGQHNILIVKSLAPFSGDQGLAVPYDFDLTGVVNADYAIPPEKLGIDNIRQPIFNGPCRTREEYLTCLEKFIAAKDSIYKIVNDFPYLSYRSKKDITGFLDSFYDQCRKQRNIEALINTFMANCRH